MYHFHLFFISFLSVVQVEDLKAKLAVQEVELWQRNSDIEALLDQIGQQTDRLNQERAVADAEEQRVTLSVCVMVHTCRWKVVDFMPFLQYYSIYSQTCNNSLKVESRVQMIVMSLFLFSSGGSNPS